MNWTIVCDFCGRPGEDGDDPHPGHDSCPYEHDHTKHNSTETLRESIQNTRAGNSVCLFGWNKAYPAFKTVFKTRSWLTTFDTSEGKFEGHEKYDTSYFKKTIWATGNPHKTDAKYKRIEYDPTRESLIDWYTVTEGAEKPGSGSFETFIRKDDSDVSFFGSTLG